jgi:hypothetical protein
MVGDVLPAAPSPSLPGSAATTVKEWHAAAAKACMQASPLSYPQVRKVESRANRAKIIAKIIASYDPTTQAT